MSSSLEIERKLYAIQITNYIEERQRWEAFTLAPSVASHQHHSQFLKERASLLPPPLFNSFRDELRRNEPQLQQELKLKQ